MGKAKSTRAMGRPTDYRPEYCTTVIEMGRAGRTWTQCAVAFGVTRDRLDVWARKHPEFEEAKEIHSEACQGWWTELGWNGAQGKIRNFNATVWIFAMKNIAGWRDKQEISGFDGQPLEIVVKSYEAESLGKKKT